MLEQTLLKLKGRTEWFGPGMSLNSLLVDLECSMAVKQAFFNVILLLAFVINQVESNGASDGLEEDGETPKLAGFVSEFK